MILNRYSAETVPFEQYYNGGNYMKKHICLLLAIAMLVCCIPFAALAAGEGYYTVAGYGTLCGSDWNPGDSNNQMTWNEETGLYEKTFESVPAGT